MYISTDSSESGISSLDNLVSNIPPPDHVRVYPRLSYRLFYAYLGRHVSTPYRSQDRIRTCMWVRYWRTLSIRFEPFAYHIRYIIPPKSTIFVRLPFRHLTNLYKNLIFCPDSSGIVIGNSYNKAVLFHQFLSPHQ